MKTLLTPLACGLVLVAVTLGGCERAPGPAPRAEEANGHQDGGTSSRASAQPPARGSGGPATRPESAESRAGTRRTYDDVPAGSRDPVVDGLKSVIREMILKGLRPDGHAELADRVQQILEIAMLGDDGRRKVEADLMAKTLLGAQEDFRPKNAPAGRTSLTTDEEQRVRVAAEALARDLYRQLAPFPAGGGGHLGAILRAAPEAKVPAGYEALAWKTLGGFEYIEHMTLPEEVQKLNGKKVGLAGYMLTLDQVENIREFLLVEAFWSCCFGTPPTMNGVAMIHVEGTKGVEYTSSPVLVLGTLEVGEKIEDGFVTSVYRIKATSVVAIE